MEALRQKAFELFFPFLSWLHTAGVQNVNTLEEMHVLRVRALIHERDDLKARIARLEGTLVRLDELEMENVRLRQVIGFGMSQAGPSVAAQVILNRSDAWHRELVVRVGESDTLAKGWVAVTDAGLVGQVIGAGKNTAQVLLITDPESRVGVMIQRSRAQGVFQGRPDGTGWIEYLERDADVEPGDQVITSGLGGVFPKGVRVGTVESVRTHPSGLFRIAGVDPAVEFSRLEEVVCVPPLSPESY